MRAGHIYEKWGSDYGRWRTAGGRHLNRRIGPRSGKGGSDGLTRLEAEQAIRRIQAEASRKPVDPVVEVLTVDRVADRLRERVAIESYRENCESMQRVYMLPAIGTHKVAAVTTEDDERLASRMLASVEALLGTTARAASTSSSDDAVHPRLTDA